MICWLLPQKLAGETALLGEPVSLDLSEITLVVSSSPAGGGGVGGDRCGAVTGIPTGSLSQQL